MDFKTLLERLNSGVYRTMEAFAEDVYLIFRNCRQFNPPGTLPVLGADVVERAFKKEWMPVMRAKLTQVEKRNLVAFLERMRNVEEWVSLVTVNLVVSDLILARFLFCSTAGIDGSETQSMLLFYRITTTISRNEICVILGQ